MKFRALGPLMLLPDAYGADFPVPEISPPKYGPHACVVQICGPLTHHPEISEPDKPWGIPKYFDNYDAIRARAEMALRTESKTVVLALDSVGGHAVGIFDTVLEIIEMARVAQKQVITWVDGTAASAAYALGLAGSKVYAAPGAIIGSIGVIAPMVDRTKQDAALGERWTLLTTGARKGDGNPHVAQTDEAIAAQQAVIDSIGQTFFDLVAERRGMKAAAVMALEAATFTAEQAKSVGLIDGIMTLDQLLAALASAENGPEGQKEATMASYKESLEGLRKAAEGEDEEAKKAKKMLAALEDDDKDEEAKKAAAEEEKKKDEEAKKAAAEEEKKKDEEAKAIAASGSGPLSATQVVSLVDKHLDAKRAQEAEQSERTALLASRRDLPQDTIKSMAGLPIASLRDLVKNMPRGPVSAVEAARAALDANPTVQAGAPGAGQLISAEEKAGMDRAMGLVKFETGGVKNEQHRLILGASSPVVGEGK